ncbi:uncharacterized protein LOC134208288 [Armigeres subalbatus]|uniref:uncharacterized protein LOC134208288 n=1 Tax=Armigeres subalbatus TaxID=124917 RepID=UPI002ED3BE36
MAFRDVVRGVTDVILNNKLITFLSVALFAFIITTIVLAEANNSNADALAGCEHKLWIATSTVAPATTTLASETTTAVTEASTTTTVVAPTTEESNPDVPGR